MIVYRLCKEKFSHDLSRRCAEISGGRWNSKGTALLYTSDSRALCTTEIAVHMPLGIVPKDFVLLQIELPDKSLIKVISPEELPDNWNVFPHPHTTQLLGDQFVQEQQQLALKVPSAVVPGDFNFLLNPRHPHFDQVKLLKLEPFLFDERLFVR